MEDAKVEPQAVAIPQHSDDWEMGRYAAALLRADATRD
jgi:hypothetical protein